MTPETVVGMLAEPVRLRVFSAAVLGAATLPEIAGAAGASPKETALALRRLVDGGLVEETGGGAHRVRGEEFKELTRAAAAAGRADRCAEEYGSRDGRTETLLRTFLRDGRLVGLPAQFRRREVVLRYLVERSFEPGVTYPESAVNARLREWCEGATVDHVTVRRHLVDLCLLGRENNRYWLRTDLRPGDRGTQQAPQG